LRCWVPWTRSPMLRPFQGVLPEIHRNGSRTWSYHLLTNYPSGSQHAYPNCLYLVPWRSPWMMLSSNSWNLAEHARHRRCSQWLKWFSILPYMMYWDYRPTLNVRYVCSVQCLSVTNIRKTYMSLLLNSQNGAMCATYHLHRTREVRQSQGHIRTSWISLELLVSPCLQWTQVDLGAQPSLLRWTSWLQTFEEKIEIQSRNVLTESLLLKEFGGSVILTIFSCSFVYWGGKMLFLSAHLRMLDSSLLFVRRTAI
jgi:hypothetical protein